MSNFVKKAEDVLTGKHHDSARSTNRGPHDSNLANKLDPRVDSDNDNRARHQAMGGTAGPHNTNVANKVDPRVDSDLDNRAPQVGNVGGYGAGMTGMHGTTSTMNTGTGTTAAGPHSSNVANKLDPRVDSTTGAQHYGQTGTTAGLNTGSTTTAGPHNSNIANKLDPRVDSDMDNRARHDAMAGSSYGDPRSTDTAGPHSSNIANKLDPRVDSDLDNRNNAGYQRAL